MHSKTLNVLGIIALVVVVLGFGAFFLWDSNEQSAELAQYQKVEKHENEKQYARSEALAKYFMQTKEEVDKTIPGFVIYGDDYSAPKNNVTLTSNLTSDINNNLFYDLNQQISDSAILQKYTLKLSVDNHAVAEEDFYTILTRFGVKPLKIAKDVLIPGKSERIAVTFMTDGEKGVSFAKQQSEKLGQTQIEDIDGQLSFTSGDKGEYTYYFLRDKNGKKAQVKKGSVVHCESMEYPENLIPILFFGNNDYSSEEDYVKSQKQMIDKQADCGGRFIVVARTNANSDLDKAMKKQFKDNYIRVANKSVGETDYSALADAIYAQMDKLGYFNSIKSSIENTNKQIKEYDKTHKG